MIRFKIDRESKVPLYHQLKESIKSIIIKGSLLPGTKFLSENQIIKDYGLSYPTVTRALRELAYEGFLIRQWGKGTFVADFRKNNSHRFVKPLINRKIGLFSSYIHDSMITNVMFIEIINGIITQGRRMGCEVEIIPELYLQSSDNEIIKQFERYEGIIILGRTFLNNPIAKDYLIRGRKPFVIISCELRDSSLFCINIKEEEAPFLAVKYFKKRGHKKIAFVSEYDKVENHPQYETFCQAVDSKGLDIPAIILKGTENEDEIKKIISTVRSVSAAYIVNETTASKMLALLNIARINVPADISLISFDATSYCAVMSPPLTCVTYSRYEMGTSAIKLLISQVNSSGRKPRTVTVKLHLIERGSVKDMST